jgi:cold shock CspA family protein
MELTGTSVDNMPESYVDSAAERLSKLCEVAETHVPIQIGITLVKHENNSFQCSTYNFYAFPWVGPELLGQDRSFLCRASALQFNADKNHVDFNKWLKHAVPYMSREDEARYLASPLSHGDTDLPRKVGLLRVWKLLCEARVPLVTHCPLDIFFLLACFEQRKLPRDPSEIAKLILQCLPCVFDTAHLHGAIGGFQSLQLVKFLEDARAMHAGFAVNQKRLPCYFDLDHDTAVRYGSGGDLAHDAGFDSLCTAKLYAYLLNLAPDAVAQGANRLFLYKCIEYLDLGRPADAGEPGSSIFDLRCEVLLVARLSQPRDTRTLKLISMQGFVYKWMDSLHVLVPVPSSDLGAVSKAAELAGRIPGAQWFPFELWRADVKRSAFEDKGMIAKTFADSMIGPSAISYEHVQPAFKSKIQAWLDVAKEPPYRGVVKKFNASGGYGFINCAESFAKFQRDVFVHCSQLANPHIGQEVLFTVSTNSRGQPQAAVVGTIDARFGLATESDSFVTDFDEGRTTVGTSSDCASDRDSCCSQDAQQQGLSSLLWLGGAASACA